jgi:hypothetical protein
MPSPGNVQRVRAKQMEEAAARKALKAQRRRRTSGTGWPRKRAEVTHRDTYETRRGHT